MQFNRVAYRRNLSVSPLPLRDNFYGGNIRTYFLGWTPFFKFGSKMATIPIKGKKEQTW